MTLKEINNAENRLVVGSLKVLSDMEGAGISAMRRDIDVLANATNTVKEKQEEYWKDLSSDTVITPLEKKLLRKQWEEITQTAAALNQVADEKGFANYAVMTLYNASFNALRKYLFETLALFDDMNVNTKIPDAEEFNRKFANYYEDQTYAQTVFQGDAPAFYKMQLSKTSVKYYFANGADDTEGGTYVPDEITATKYGVFTDGMKETDYGEIRAVVLPQNLEIGVGNWYPVGDSLYQEDRIYGVKLTPIYIVTEDGTPILADADNIGILYLRRE